MKNPKVSVIIPVYNAQEYLAESIESVRSQTMQDFEIICIDDGSTDDSGIILKKYAEQDVRIKVLSQTNCGVSVARNEGINIARGEYLYFLDSDDYIEPDLLETACYELDNKYLDVVFFDTYAFGEEGISQELVNEKNKYYVRNSEYPAIYTGEELLIKLLDNHDYNCTVWMQLIRRDFQQEHKLRFYNGIIHEDELYTVQMMMLAKRAAYIQRTLHHRRLRKNSIITKPLEFESVYGYFVCVKELYCFLLQQVYNKKQLEPLLALLRCKIFSARNQFLKLSEKEQLKYEKLSEQEKFLFYLCILDFTSVSKQRSQIQEKLNEVQQKVLKLEQMKNETTKKLGETQQKVLKLEQMKNETTKKLGETQQKVLKLEQAKIMTIEEIKKAQSKITKLEKDLNNVKTGWSFRIGRIITWVPRKIKEFL